ncbi:MAG: hypothetical protein O7A04_12915 [Acidobacteria bacterium]|nr:hypothetical protein [Acidobacteriota bacterium]
MTGATGPELEYFRAIEDTFIRLRGTPFLLSPSDWRLAALWYGRGIPVGLVCRALEELFERRAERGKSGKVQSLRYCASTVEDAWRERRELGSESLAGQRRAIDVAARLDRLADALPADLDERSAWAGRIRAAGDEPQEAESVLVTLDSELVDRCIAGLTPASRGLLAAEVDSSLEAVSQRLAADVLAADRERLLRAAARRQAGLPLLSLFSPDARAI